MESADDFTFTILVCMDKKEILQNAKKLSENRLQSAPDFKAFQSIDNQLQYLQDLVSGKITDRSKIKEINVGLYAIREFEESDPEFSSYLKKVQYIAERIRKGLKV